MNWTAIGALGEVAGAAFGTDPIFRSAFPLARAAEGRASLQPAERVVIDIYLLSITNIFEQLVREVNEGVLDAAAIDSFRAQAIFDLPYYRNSWPFYARALSHSFVAFAEARLGLDSSPEHLPPR